MSCGQKKTLSAAEIFLRRVDPPNPTCARTARPMPRSTRVMRYLPCSATKPNDCELSWSAL